MKERKTCGTIELICRKLQDIVQLIRCGLKNNEYQGYAPFLNIEDT